MQGVIDSLLSPSHYLSEDAMTCIVRDIAFGGHGMSLGKRQSVKSNVIGSKYLGSCYSVHNERVEKPTS